MMRGEPLNQAIPRIFEQVFTVFPSEERSECGTQAGLGFVQQYVR